MIGVVTVETLTPCTVLVDAGKRRVSFSREYYFLRRSEPKYRNVTYFHGKVHIGISPKKSCSYLLSVESKNKPF